MMNLTVLRLNLDVFRWKNCESSSSVDLESIYCRREMRAGLTRIAMKNCMMILLTCLAQCF